MKLRSWLIGVFLGVLVMGGNWTVFAQEVTIGATPIEINSAKITGGSAELRVAAKIRKQMKRSYKGGEKVVIELLNTTGNIIEAEVRNEKGEKVDSDVEIDQSGEVTMVLVSPPPQFSPGKYRVKVWDGVGMETEQDFLWGVLALNTNKYIYRPMENSLISIAVLNEQGKMTCDARVVLEIKNVTTGKTDTLSTENGKIIVNPECFGYEYTLKSDYEAEYMVGGETGVYEMILTAETKNGINSIENQFEVAESGFANIDRNSITRVYPPYIYPMTLAIKMGVDFKGEIVETVPFDFQIESQNLEGVKNYDRIEEVPKKGLKKIVWEVDVKSGDELNLGYSFKTPIASPQFYTIGPLIFEKDRKMEFSEKRVWQIAVDAISVVQIDQYATTSAGTTQVTASFTPSANKLYLMWTIQTFGTATSIPTVSSNSGLTWVQVETKPFFTVATPLKRITLFRAMKSSGLSAGTNIITWGQNATGRGHVILEFSVVDTSGTDGSGAIVQSGVGATNNATAGAGLSIYLNNLTSSNNMTAGGFGNELNDTASLIAGTGYTAGTGVAFASPATTLKAEWSGVGSTLVNMTQNATADIGGIAVEIKVAQITISGSCKQYDMMTNCAVGETIRLAVGGVLNPTTTTISGGTFVFSGIDSPSANAVLTAYVQGEEVAVRANTVTEYAGSGNVTELNLFERHLTIGHSGGVASIGNTDLANYDNSVAGTGGSEVFFEVDVGNTLTTDVRSQFGQYKLYVYPGNVYQPAGKVVTQNIDIGGTLTAEANTIDVSGSFTNSGTFNAGTGNVTLSGGSTAVVSLVGSTAMTFKDIYVAVPGKMVQFQAGVGSTPVFNIDGVLTVTGVAGTPVYIQSNTLETRWLANFSLTQTRARYANILDSGCMAGGANVNLYSYSTDGGNNGTCWVFGGSEGPTVDQLMRHGSWFSGGVKQQYSFKK